MFTPRYVHAALILLTICSCTISANYCSAQGVATLEQVAEVKLQAALKREVSWDFVETPLNKVIEELRKTTDVSIIINTQELEAVGTGSDTPVSIRLTMSLESALNHMLRNLELTWTIRDEALVITTPDDAETNLIVRVYPVGDLVEPVRKPAEKTEGAKEKKNYYRVNDNSDPLIDTIVGAIAPETWDEAGGSASISYFRGTLVVNQTYQMHAQLEQFFVNLRKALP